MSSMASSAMSSATGMSSAMGAAENYKNDGKKLYKVIIETPKINVIYNRIFYHFALNNHMMIILHNQKMDKNEKN